MNSVKDSISDSGTHRGLITIIVQSQLEIEALDKSRTTEKRIPGK